MSVEEESRIPTDVEIGNGGGAANDDRGAGDTTAPTPGSAAASAAPGASVLVMERLRSLRVPRIALPSWRRRGDDGNRRADDGDSIGTIHLSDLGGSGDEFDDDGTIVEDEAWLRDSIRRIRESRLVAANKDMGDKFIRTRVTAVAVLIAFLVLVAVLLAVLNGRVSTDEMEATSPIGDATGNVTDVGGQAESQP